MSKKLSCKPGYNCLSNPFLFILDFLEMHYSVFEIQLSIYFHMFKSGLNTVKAKKQKVRTKQKMAQLYSLLKGISTSEIVSSRFSLSWTQSAQTKSFHQLFCIWMNPGTVCSKDKLPSPVNVKIPWKSTVKDFSFAADRKPLFTKILSTEKRRKNCKK